MDVMFAVFVAAMLIAPYAMLKAIDEYQAWKNKKKIWRSEK